MAELNHEAQKQIKESNKRPDSAQSWEDDRIEFVEIPKRGKFQTQIFETRTRVHCYFDPEESTWLRLPIAWELYSPAARHLVNLVKDVCPRWSADADILAALRVSNYNVDDCVNTYHSSVGRDPMVTGIDPGRSDTTEVYPSVSPPPKQTPEDQNETEKSKLLAEVERLRTELWELSQELSRERSAHQELKMSIANETEQKSPRTSREKGAPKRCVVPLQRTKSYCQDIHQLTQGMKRSVQELYNTLKPLLKKTHRIHVEQRNKLMEAQAMYRLEAQQRRLTYNTLIELRGNIRVFCRIRPVGCQSSKDCWLQNHDNGELLAQLPNASRRKFEFDHVFHVEATQDEVFSKLSDIIASSVDGYNVCIMAYGQTGSGKTYTMEGPPDKPGVNILSIRELLRIVRKRQKVDFELSMSILEIYNENVVDLLSPVNSCESVEIRHNNQSVCIVGANWVPVKDEADMHRAISMGQKGRHVAETKLNSSSSRSHLIVSVCVIGTDKISGSVSRGQLTLCDLAGSERVEKSGATSGERFQEATYINRSLSALAQVFVALRNNQLHIPYRNTKLTQMLQPCLGGDAKTCLIVNVTTDPASVSETLSTLQFGNNARQVALGPARPHVTTTDSQ